MEIKDKLKSIFFIISIAFCSLTLPSWTHQNPKEKNIFTDVQDIFVSGKDIYAAGSMCTDGTSQTNVPILWKNGVARKIGKEGNWNTASSVFVSNGNVYVTISENGSSYLWKNGERQSLGDFSACCVFVVGKDVYLAGSIRDSAAIWKNGKIQNLGLRGYASSIIVREDETYVLGQETWSEESENLIRVYVYPFLWKNGEIRRPGSGEGYAEALYISSNGDVYIAGSYNNQAALWKNGERQELENAGRLSCAYSVTQTADGRVFVGGHAYDEQNYNFSGNAVVWVDGKYVLVDDKFHETKTIVADKNTVYLGGLSGRGPKWAVWKYDGKSEFFTTNLIRANDDGVIEKSIPDKNNPIVNRISQKELQENKTPRAVAYNFIDALLKGDNNRVLSCMEEKIGRKWEEDRIQKGYENFGNFFEEEEMKTYKGGKLNIMGWKPYLANGCEIAVTFGQDEDYENYSMCKIYVECVLSSEIGYKGFQDITSYGGTNVKVLVEKTIEGWKVVGFK